MKEEDSMPVIECEELEEFSPEAVFGNPDTLEKLGYSFEIGV